MMKSGPFGPLFPIDILCKNMYNRLINRETVVNSEMGVSL